MICDCIEEEGYDTELSDKNGIIVECRTCGNIYSAWLKGDKENGKM